MLAIFESILPIFLLLVAGNILRRLPFVDAAGWRGLEQLGYWVLYPTLLFATILNADFSGLQLDAMMAALLVSVLGMCAATYALWPLLDRSGLVARGEFSSLFQTTIRWNGFMALAIAQNIFPPAGMAVVALAMAVIVIPINICSVYVVTRFADRSADWPRIMRSMATNPLILSCVIAITMRWLPDGLYEPLDETFQLVARAAIGMGLLAIGAGLRPGDLLGLRPALLVPVVLKLIVFPLLMISTAIGFGVSGESLVYLALCAAVPTAMNGYFLARQLGGDAELYASVATLQTALSFLSIPVALAAAAQLAAG